MSPSCSRANKLIKFVHPEMYLSISTTSNRALPRSHDLARVVEKPQGGHYYPRLRSGNKVGGARGPGSRPTSLLPRCESSQAAARRLMIRIIRST